MADIDKGLPNTRNKLEIPSEEELQDVAVQEPVEEKGPIEVIPEEDGGVTLDYEPGAINVPGTESHFDNLAELLPDDVLASNRKRNDTKLYGLQNFKKRMGTRIYYKV